MAVCQENAARIFAHIGANNSSGTALHRSWFENLQAGKRREWKTVTWGRPVGKTRARTGQTRVIRGRWRNKRDEMETARAGLMGEPGSS